MSKPAHESPPPRFRHPRVADRSRATGRVTPAPSRPADVGSTGQIRRRRARQRHPIVLSLLHLRSSAEPVVGADAVAGGRQHDDVTFRLIRTGALRADGWSERRIRAAVAAGDLARLRPGAYGHPWLPDPCRSAARIQGRVTCVSALALLGVFVLQTDGVHVHVPRTASRLPAADASIRRIHRRRLLRTPHPDALLVEPIDALADAVRCQPPRAAVASIDSALQLGVLRVDELDELFSALPARYRPLRRLVDGRAESRVARVFCDSSPAASDVASSCRY